jgi:fructokinase
MIGLGELLWDFLPSGRFLGGAPTNFAYMCNVLGNEGIIASRVGSDELGSDALDWIKRLGLSTDYVQIDEVHETGTAEVLLDGSGQPQFTIKEPVAWDYLQWTDAWQGIASRADVVCFGSLAQRSSASAETIERFLQFIPEKTLRICDANLREPFYTRETLQRSFSHADLLKLNDQELIIASTLFDIVAHNEIELARGLLNLFNLDLICVTKGARGSLLVSNCHVSVHPGLNVRVADAVGAGDAFTACLAHLYIQGRPLDEISENANRFAAWVATQVGATPIISRTQLEEVLGA